MVKSYVKYEQSHSFGVVCTGSSNLVWAPQEDASTSKTGAGVAYVSANEEVLSWDVRKGQLLSRWKDVQCNAEVTAVSKSTADESIFAVGHADGSIRIWDARTDTCLITFNGHKSAVTTLQFDRTGARLASGSKDTDIILWDLLSEVGLFKLRGHKDQVTALCFLYPQALQDEERLPPPSEGNVLLSTSKDALIKVWELSSQHCIETHVAQTNGECWAMSVSPDGTGCITAGNDGELKVWSINSNVLATSLSDRGLGESDRVLHEMGLLYRQGKDRTTGIQFHHKADYIAIHGTEKAVEIWRIRGEEEIKKSLARKRKRRREKATQKGEEIDEDMLEDNGQTDIKEVFVPYTIVRTGGKIRSVAWARTKSSRSLQLIATATNNLIEAYTVTTKERIKKSKDDTEVEYDRISSVELPGHRADVRAVALSSDDKMLATASNGSLKIWNVQTRTCIRTLECGYALCVSFVPGDKIVVVGTKSGELELFDIASSTLLEKIQAHDGSVWTLAVHPGGQSLVTGSADKCAKFWAFEVFQEEIPGTKRTTKKLRLKHTRILKLNDDVLKLCFSPDARLLALSTLDNTVKVFFTDSLKVFLNLYGHKLPVLDITISSDNKLITTCSADKNIRIWGLDFGDCHKAIFAHQDSIMAVQFIPHPVNRDDAHIFFSASKDRTLKSWDGDKFEQIQKLDAHHGEIWSLAVSRTGDFVVTASHDKSIRIWAQTDEPLFLEEEREKDLEELHEAALQATLNDEDDGTEARDQLTLASKQTIQTLTAGEKIAEALELGVADLAIVERYEAQKKDNPNVNVAPPQRDPLFMALGGISAERHVLNTMARIPAPSLQDALLVLPFSMLPSLFTFLAIFVRRKWNMPLTCRVLFFMLKTHQRQIVSSGELRLILEGMRDDLRASLESLKDVLGFNLAALRFVGGKVKDNENVRLEDVLEDNSDKNVRKRAFVEVA
ncbi:F-box/WD repeat-containing protein pof1 [Pseudovirgaria hyperparasitica]|uniref:F-box/WD repeat-containing protein pof1 n=1 Tax=Pseudovirgaria hyperparasitica TaxID=470096 RepID=A0A6A6W3Z6_9PEZI|nr:F-box/WD repeat-containing protein pof1 [Pseudovirgaria hyperparasitica]KAF2756670.1 F-box/WD repeat-containing protein pof1 [Pseudovirgaria hyperparasitica]